MVSCSREPYRRNVTERYARFSPEHLSEAAAQTTLKAAGAFERPSLPTGLATVGHDAIRVESAKPLILMALPTRFERVTYGLGNQSESMDSADLHPNMANPWPTSATEAAKALLRDIADGRSIVPERAHALADTIL